MKKAISILTAGVVALGLTFSAAACNDMTSASAEYAYVAIDINPSIELLVKEGVVVEVKACNDDAAVLLEGESLVGKTVEEAGEQIVALAEELGYLTTDNDQVKITVLSDDGELAEKVEKKVKDGAKKGSNKAKVNSNPRAADERKVKELQAENPELYKDLTPAKLRLIETIMRFDDTMTYEQGAAMTVSELADILDELADEFKDVVGDGMEKEYERRFREQSLEKERAIAMVYGEEYLAAWEKYVALEQAYETLEEKAEMQEISETDAAAIAELFGLESAAQIVENGVLTVEAVERYFDKHFDDIRGFDDDEYEDTLEEILEKYDEDGYVLTAEDLAALEGYLDGTSVETLEDLEKLVEGAEEALEDLRESIRLTAEQRAEIEKLQGEKRDVKGEILESMKPMMEQAKEDFRQKKQGKMERR